jgi:hypothetical protein
MQACILTLTVTRTHIKTGIPVDGIMWSGRRVLTVRRNIPWQVPEKCCYISTNLRGITYQSIDTALRNSYLANDYRFFCSSSVYANCLLITAARLVFLMRYMPQSHTQNTTAQYYTARSHFMHGMCFWRPWIIQYNISLGNKCKLGKNVFSELINVQPQ